MSFTNLTKDNFDKYISGNTNNVIYFGTEKCSLCELLRPLYEEFANNIEINNIYFYELDTALDKRHTIELKVMNQPTILFLEGRKEIARLHNNDITNDNILKNINKFNNK